MRISGLEGRFVNEGGCPTTTPVFGKLCSFVKLYPKSKKLRFLRIYFSAVNSFISAKNKFIPLAILEFQIFHLPHLLSFCGSRLFNVLYPTTRQNPVVGYWVIFYKSPFHSLLFPSVYGGAVDFNLKFNTKKLKNENIYKRYHHTV